MTQVGIKIAESASTQLQLSLQMDMNLLYKKPVEGLIYLPRLAC